MKNLLQPSLSLPTMATATEMQLLCCCARLTLDECHTAQANELISQDIDWQSLVQLAMLHGVMPLLCKNLIGFGSEAIPASVIKEIKAYFHLNALRNQTQTRELMRLLNLFAQRGMSVVPFKGPLLAVQAYGALSLRQFGDLDILVSPDDFVAARDLLFAHGYERAKTFWGVIDIELQEQDLMRRWGECPLRSANGQFEVDLHSRLMGGEFPILSADFSVFWDRLSPTTVLKREVRSFCPEDLLLYLCVHGSKDLWKRLNWVCDVATLIQEQPELDWAVIIERSQSLECEQMLWLGISLAESLLGIELPEIALERRRSHFTKQAFLTQIEAQLLSGISPKLICYTQTQRVYFHGQLLGNRRDQLIHYLKFMKHITLHRFKPNIYDKAFLSLPSQLYFLYYLIRPVRLLFNALRRAEKEPTTP